MGDHTTTAALAGTPPQRPCGTCGQRAWRQRTKPPAGAWECRVCWPQEQALASEHEGQRRGHHRRFAAS